jgi:hypothetical protein
LHARPPFPPPWSVEEEAACFVLRDHGEQAFYFEDEPGRRSAAKLLERAEQGGSRRQPLL